jgi:hypothetical protein
MPFSQTPRPPLSGGGGLRQYQADFIGTLVNASKTARPDAVVLDPLTAYTTGPKAIGDQSDGPTAWVWRVRVSGFDVLIARENAARNGWDAEAILFTFTGVAPVDVDMSFEQAARAVVCMARPTGALGASQIWLYYFDSTVPGFVFSSFGVGRTPRVVLDNPQTPNESDVLLVYLDMTADRLRLRQQRDRYLTAYDSPLTGVADMFLEELVLTVDNRIRCVLTVRDVASGTYTFRLLDSTLYPFTLAVEDAFRPAHPGILATSTVRRALLSAGPPPFGTPSVSEDALVDPDAFRPSHPVVLNTSAVGAPLIVHLVFPDDAFRPSHPAVLNTSAIGVPLIVHLVFPDDAFRPSHPVVLNSSLLGSPLIQNMVFPDDAFRPGHPVLLNTSTLA